MRERLFLMACLALMGAGWGATQPLAKIAVSAGYRHIGLIFWQMVIGAMVMAAIQLVRRRRLILTGPAIRLYVLIALIGTLLPNSATYEALRYLPSGVISILLSLVPLFAFPIALLLGNEKFRWVRFVGLALGLAGVLLIVGPEASLPERAMVVFIPLALIAPLFYGLEGNVVAKWGLGGLQPVDVLYGASIVGAVLALPVAIASGQFIDPRGPWGAPDVALVISSVIHVLVCLCLDGGTCRTSLRGSGELLGDWLRGGLGDAHSWRDLFGVDLGRNGCNFVRCIPSSTKSARGACGVGRKRQDLRRHDADFQLFA